MAMLLRVGENIHKLWMAVELLGRARVFGAEWAEQKAESGCSEQTQSLGKKKKRA